MGNPTELKIRCGEWDTQHQSEPYPHQDRDVQNLAIHQSLMVATCRMTSLFSSSPRTLFWINIWTLLVCQLLMKCLMAQHVSPLAGARISSEQLMLPRPHAGSTRQSPVTSELHQETSVHTSATPAMSARPGTTTRSQS